MGIKKGSRAIAAIVAFSCTVAIIWMSCTKVGSNPNTCEGVVCLNNAYCHMDAITKKPACICPTGFEGVNCGTASVAKYIGTWNMMQIVVGSDSGRAPNGTFTPDTSHYQVTISNSATPTTFFINNFGNNQYYNQIICTLDSTNSFIFSLDTISAYHLLFDHYHLLYGYGQITGAQNEIMMDVATRHLSATTNWVNDTMRFIMTH